MPRERRREREEREKRGRRKEVCRIRIVLGILFVGGRWRLGWRLWAWNRRLGFGLWWLVRRVRGRLFLGGGCLGLVWLRLRLGFGLGGRVINTYDDKSFLGLL